VLRGEDVVLLLKLAGSDPDWTIRSLAEDVGIARSVVHRSLGRLEASGLFTSKKRRVNGASAEEFLVHAVKFIFPPEFGGDARGVPTSWAAAPLIDRLAPQAGEPPVWPYPQGSTRGIALRPVHPVAPTLSRSDPDLAESLALVDGLRTGDARLRGLAAELLHERLVKRGPGL
jgi:DNA-binding transcriptional MocR family regulator